MPEPGPVAASPPPHSLAPAASRRYRAFISYSHTDTTWARWLMRRLESYSVPRRFQGRAAPIGAVERRIAPVFRDRDELPTTSDLGETIRAALRESATLIVICSPASAKSRWVQEEITAFKRLHGERGVFAFIVSGEPKIAGAPDDCFSPALRTEVGADGELSGAPAEVVAADARSGADGPKTAFVRLVAGLLGVGFDELRQRELQRRNRRLTLITACSVAGMGLTLGLAAMAWQARNEAVLARNDAQRRQDQAEELHAFMLGDVRKEVEKVGRLDALEAVFNASMAYYGALHPRDLTDTALARQAKSLTQLGDVRMKQARHAEAHRAYAAAHLRAEALAQRHPLNPDMLFERAQAEFGIGHVELRRGDANGAARWLTRYRDSVLALAGLEPGTFRAESEVISGHRNLAVLERDRGNFGAARRGFEAALEKLTQLSAAYPTDHHLKFRIADTHSWLGSIALCNGDLRGAVLQFAAQIRRLEVLCANDPKSMRWKHGLAEAWLLQRDAMDITGQTADAREALRRATALIQPLVIHDPTNRDWTMTALHCRLRDAERLLRDGEVAAAQRKGQAARESVLALLVAEPTKRAFARHLAFAWRLEARCQQAIDLEASVAAAQAACEIGERLLSVAQPEVWAAPELALSFALVGELELRRADATRAARHLQRALLLVAPALADSADWRMLDAAARTLALLGRKAEHDLILSRLDALGYHAADPWPAPLLSETQIHNQK